MLNSIKRIAALSRIILIDGMRRYALIGLVGLALASEAGGLLFFDLIHRDIGRASTDFIFSVSWVAGFIFLFFHAVQVMAWDEERRVIHTLLARPLSRSEYVIGVFGGLGSLLFLLNLALAIIGWVILLLIRQQVDAAAYFNYFSYAYYLLNWIGLFGMELMMLAVIMLLSGLIRGSFPVLLVSLAFYMICSGLPVVRELFAMETTEPSKISIHKILTGMTSVFPDFSRLDFKNAVVSAVNLPTASLVLTNFGLVIAYTVLMLWFACAVYQRRDLQ